MRAALLAVAAFLVVGCSDPAGSVRLARHFGPEDLKPTLARLDAGANTIVCQLPGGNTVSTLALAREVERRGITVVVPAGATCQSGGAYLVLAAARKGNAEVSESGAVRLHPRYAAPPGWRPGRTDIDNTQFVKRRFEEWAPAWMAYGVSEETLREVDKKDYGTFYQLKPEELIALGVKLTP
jgi:hypothetical protein